MHASRCFTAGWTLRKRDGTQTHRADGRSESAAARGGQDQRIAGIELREVANVGQRRDLVVRRARDINHRWRIDRLVLAEIIGVQLDHSERRVRDQDELVAVLLVRHHVERLIACARDPKS